MGPQVVLCRVLKGILGDEEAAASVSRQFRNAMFAEGLLVAKREVCRMFDATVNAMMPGFRDFDRNWVFRSKAQLSDFMRHMAVLRFCASMSAFEQPRQMPRSPPIKKASGRLWCHAITGICLVSTNGVMPSRSCSRPANEAPVSPREWTEHELFQLVAGYLNWDYASDEYVQVLLPVDWTCLFTLKRKLGACLARADVFKPEPTWIDYVFTKLNREIERPTPPLGDYLTIGPGTTKRSKGDRYLVALLHRPAVKQQTSAAGQQCEQSAVFKAAFVTTEWTRVPKWDQPCRNEEDAVDSAMASASSRADHGTSSARRTQVDPV